MPETNNSKSGEKNGAKPKKAPVLSFGYLLYDLIRISAAPGLIIFRPKRIYAGKKPDFRGGMLIVSNHIGFSDPIDLMMLIPERRLRFVCMKEFWASRTSAFWFRSFLTIPVDRENFGMDSFRQITDRLGEGCAVAMFPEGHIDTEGNPIGGFKSGMVLMALKAGVPVLPVLLTERKKPFGRVKAVFGEPIDLAAFCGERPSFAKINEAASYIIEKEKALAEYAGH
ncbi:MAG: 1-acyl-sn-glycerol-3-phosphate acyltransferase [Clostridia bacterium]|nr:1-acyl-sn-glycerol-3-phosphate acyltransferase [Clostridia bacterium]